MPDPQPQVDTFMRLFLEHEPRLRGFVRTLVPDPEAAADVMQETSTILWKKFTEYRDGTNFFAWAAQIARFEAHRHRRCQARDRILFSDAFLEQIADETIGIQDELARRQRLLQVCIRRLRAVDQDLLYLRYQRGASIPQVAGQVRRSAAAIYKALARIREALIACVDGAGEGELET